MAAKPRIVVLGGGFAGLESAFSLRHKLREKADITLISDSGYFLFKPNTIYIPFGDDPEKYKVYLDAPTRKKEIDLIQGRAEQIDPDRRTVKLHDFEVAFDYLIVASGAALCPQEIMGLEKHALTLWTPEDMLRLRQAYRGMLEKARAGERQKLLFLVPPFNTCASPLYEIALMTDTWLRNQGVRGMIEITWTTFEESFLHAFGPRLGLVIAAEFEDRAIAGYKGFAASAVEPGTVIYQNGETRQFDLLVSFPPYMGANRFPSLPLDARGFIRVERDSRRVQGRDRIFAAGDAADFPLKQAYLALLQAGAAADHIAAEIENRKPEVLFEPVTMCLMEEFDKATFAQVPLRYTGDPKKPVTVDLEDSEHYKIGVSPLWRAGKKALGLYLPWRFASGEPFHTGFARDIMDAGLKTMARVMTH